MKSTRVQTTVAGALVTLFLALPVAHAEDYSELEERIEAIEEQQMYADAMAAGDAARACGKRCGPVPVFKEDYPEQMLHGPDPAAWEKSLRVQTTVGSDE